MSRIFVKNLPKSVEENELRSHFAKLGEITDFKLLYSEDGKFRRIAIIGFRSADAGEKAIKLYNRTYFRSSVINIEAAKSRGEIEQEKKLTEDERERHYSEREERRKRAQGGGSTVLDKLLSTGGDLLSEYLNINSQKSWSDAPTLDKKDLERTGMIKNNSDANADAPRVGSSAVVKKHNILESSAKNLLFSDPAKIRPIEREIDPSKIKISGLPTGFSEEELKQNFEKYGEVKEAICCIDPLTKVPTGVGYVTFSLPEHASRALGVSANETISLEEMAEKKMGAEMLIAGKMCRLWPACVPRTMMDEEALMNQKRKEYRAKGRDVANKLTWNSTMQRSDTVAGVVAERLDLSKADIANDAVGLAIAEASLANEAVKKLREECGVDLTDNDPTSTRSKTVILAKNLPKDISAVIDLRPLFESYGRVLTCVIPIEGFAVITMAEPNDARRAYNKLAFHRIGAEKAPMFLEFANMLDVDINADLLGPESADANSDDEEQEPIRTVYVKNIAFSTSVEEVKKVCMKLPGCLSVTMQASNVGHKGYGWLEFKTPSEARSALKVLNKVTKDGFRWTAEASENNTMGNKRTIVLGTTDENSKKGGKNRGAREDESKIENENENEDTTRSGEKNRRNNDDDDDDKKLTSPKLLIKNVPFQASAKELKDLMSQFGRIQRFSAPKKFDGGLRGFAFVEYASVEEAQKALDMMRSTHFYGRHLVVLEANDYINNN